MTKFVPPPNDKRKRGGGGDDDDEAATADDDDADLSKVNNQNMFNTVFQTCKTSFKYTRHAIVHILLIEYANPLKAGY